STIGLPALTRDSASTTIDAGAVFELNDATSSFTVNSLQGAGTVSTGTKTATKLILRSGDFSGVISGTGQLVQDGLGGKSILSGSNTYSGGTTVTTGTLQIGKGGISGSIF